MLCRRGYSSSLLSIPSQDVNSQQFLKPGSDIQCEKCYSEDETHITVQTVFSVCTGDKLHTEEGHLQSAERFLQVVLQSTRAKPGGLV